MSPRGWVEVNSETEGMFDSTLKMVGLVALEHFPKICCTNLRYCSTKRFGLEYTLLCCSTYLGCSVYSTAFRSIIRLKL